MDERGPRSGEGRCSPLDPDFPEDSNTSCVKTCDFLRQMHLREVRERREG